jgi:hypothetical protein
VWAIFPLGSISFASSNIFTAMSSNDSSPPSTLHSHSEPEKKHEKTDVEIANIEEIGLKESVFDDPKLAEYYKPIPEYEGYHRFDPTAVWTAEEERVLVRKIDWRIMAWCCLMFIALQLDRGNIGMQVYIRLVFIAICL